MRFSFVTLLRNSIVGHTGWPEQWRAPEPKAAYDVIIVGAGGHGLATAYYLAAQHGVTNVAVLEKGWLGIDNEWLTPQKAKEFCPPLNIVPGMRYPILGAALQRRGGVARHDAVAWGYARGADAHGVDIIQNCEVTAIRRDANGAVAAVETTRGTIRTSKLGVVAAGHSSVVLAMADLRMPLESFPLQALVSEPLKPILSCVLMSNTIHAYISQSD